MCQDGANTLCWYFNTEYTYDLALTDAGTVNQIKYSFGVYYYE